MREEKTSVVEEVKEWVSEAQFIIVTDYTGMKVEEFTELRNRLAAVGSQYHVVKNTYIRKALEIAGLPEVSEQLKGQSAVCYGEDISSAAKILKNFHAEFERPLAKAGIMDGKVLGAADIKTLADLPSREVLLASLVGMINTPATTLARLIGTPGTQLAQVIKAKSEKGE